ncbi:MAG: ATP-binding protein [Candidatus Marinimicrobia bacterium]|nr:ATP-binding protein [Candidatus Neomarinimicrobiota bacterium]
MKTEFVIKTAERVEIPQFPIEAFREAVVNAIMHRDYFDKSSDIFIESYRNKIVIFNPGGLVKWLKQEEFGKVSKTRNPIIASLLARTIFAEKLGTGIERIRRAMKDKKLPMPYFEYYINSFYINLYDKNYDTKNINRTKIGHKSDANRTQIGHKSEDIRRRWILNFLKENETIRSLDIIYEFKIVKDTVSRDLKSLIQQNKIMRKGGGSNVWYELKKCENSN